MPDLDSPIGELGQLAGAFNGEETRKLSRAHRQVMHVEKMAALGTLAATVAHELNNPLAGILNYAKLAERSLVEAGKAGTPQSPEEAAENLRFLRVIQQEASRCGKIVRNFLVFARRSGGEFALCSLNAIAEQALAILRHHLEMKGVELAWTPIADTGEGGDEIVCDAGQIQQALLDLFVNAIEAMPQGGTLTVLARQAKEGVEILVADTGVGIPDDALLHIFEPFYTTKQESGSGLGLSVVWGIVERHGGTIEVDSEMGKGTVFRLTLPRHPPPMTSRNGASGESHE